MILDRCTVHCLVLFFLLSYNPFFTPFLPPSLLPSISYLNPILVTLPCTSLLLPLFPSPSFLSYRFIMEKVDIVMVGAEGVAESGGIINKVSTKIR